MTKKSYVTHIKLSIKHTSFFAIQLFQSIQDKRHICNQDIQAFDDESFLFGLRARKCPSPSVAQPQYPPIRKYSALVIISVVYRSHNVTMARQFLKDR